MATPSASPTLSQQAELSLKELTDLYRIDEQLVRAGGGKGAIARQHEKGRLTARERIELLVDGDGPREAAAMKGVLPTGEPAVRTGAGTGTAPGFPPAAGAEAAPGFAPATGAAGTTGFTAGAGEADLVSALGSDFTSTGALGLKPLEAGAEEDDGRENAIARPF